MQASDRTRQQLIGHLLDAARVLDISHGDVCSSADFAGRALRLCSPMDQELADRAQYRIEQLDTGCI